MYNIDSLIQDQIGDFTDDENEALDFLDLEDYEELPDDF